MKIEKVNEDSRGEVFVITGGPKKYDRLVLLTTKSGYARGGDYHKKSKQNCTVIDGCMLYTLKGSPTLVLKAGDTVVSPRNIPHIFFALKDSLMMEWGPKRKDAYFDKEMRSEVVRNNLENDSRRKKCVK